MSGVDTWLARGLLVAAVVALVIVACWRATWWFCVAAASVGSRLVAPHVYGYDAGLLLIAIWLAIFVCRDKWTRIVATLVCTPIPFLMTLAGTPWAATTPVVLLIFLICLTGRSLRRISKTAAA